MGTNLFRNKYQIIKIQKYNKYFHRFLELRTPKNIDFVLVSLNYFVSNRNI